MEREINKRFLDFKMSGNESDINHINRDLYNNKMNGYHNTVINPRISIEDEMQDAFQGLIAKNYDIKSYHAQQMFDLKDKERQLEAQLQEHKKQLENVRQQKKQEMMSNYKQLLKQKEYIEHQNRLIKHTKEKEKEIKQCEIEIEQVHQDIRDKHEMLKDAIDRLELKKTMMQQQKYMIQDEISQYQYQTSYEPRIQSAQGVTKTEKIKNTKKSKKTKKFRKSKKGHKNKSKDDYDANDANDANYDDANYDQWGNSQGVAAHGNLRYPEPYSVVNKQVNDDSNVFKFDGNFNQLQHMGMEGTVVVHISQLVNSRTIVQSQVPCPMYIEICTNTEAISVATMLRTNGFWDETFELPINQLYNNCLVIKLIQIEYDSPYIKDEFQIKMPNLARTKNQGNSILKQHAVPLYDGKLIFSTQFIKNPQKIIESSNSSTNVQFSDKQSVRLIETNSERNKEREKYDQRKREKRKYRRFDDDYKNSSDGKSGILKNKQYPLYVDQSKVAANVKSYDLKVNSKQSNNYDNDSDSDSSEASVEKISKHKPASKNGRSRNRHKYNNSKNRRKYETKNIRYKNFKQSDSLYHVKGIQKLSNKKKLSAQSSLTDQKSAKFAEKQTEQEQEQEQRQKQNQNVKPQQSQAVERNAQGKPTYNGQTIEDIDAELAQLRQTMTALGIEET